MPITTKPTVFFGHQFTTRKVLTAFMDWLGRHLYVEKYDENGAIYRYIQVPVQFARRERFMSLIKANNQKYEFNEKPNVEIDLNRILPRMSVDIVGLTYDPERHVSKFQKVRETSYDASGTLGRIPAPVPYELELEVAFIAKTVDDNFQIMEQILPYFTPSFSLDLNIIPGFDPQSVAFLLQTINPDVDDEIGVDDERIFITTMNFLAKVNYYFLKKDDKIVKKIIANYYVGDNDAAFEEAEMRRFKQYEWNVINTTPVTTVAERETEPVTTISSERVFSNDFSTDFL